MTRTVGIGFIGAGLVAQLHGRAVRACPQARFVGVYDTKPARARALVRRFGGRTYRDLSSLLNESDIDAVHVLTPPAGHVSSTVAALEAGKHVLLEKPVADRAADIRRIMRVAKKQDRVCMPGRFGRRWQGLSIHPYRNRSGCRRGRLLPRRVNL